MSRAVIGIGLVLAVGAIVACGSITPVPHVASEVPFVAPAVWLDLPDSPFTVSHIGPRAVLVNRTGMAISSIDVGCVRELNGIVTVVSPLWTTDLTDGVWTHEHPVTRVLEEISRLYRNPEVPYPLDPWPRRPCPADSNPTITQSSSSSGFKWSASGTPWPKGPPHDTRNTWRVTAKATPSFEYVSSGGCADADVYASNKTDTEMLWVRLDLNRKKLPTATRPLVVKLSNSSSAHQIQLHVYQTDRHNWFCSDVVWWGMEEPTIWLPRRGIVTVWADPLTKDFVEYPVTIRIEDAEFVGPGGATIRPGRTLVIQAMAGAMVGG